ncbi:hypothetical protein CDD83_504 [Cordyceps sp. RAO-2017]|nr:hypothetical protein CDD83_504 [Cordyceps sp. RAO-2017]
MSLAAILLTLLPASSLALQRRVPPPAANAPNPFQGVCCSECPSILADCMRRCVAVPGRGSSANFFCQSYECRQERADCPKKCQECI